VILYILLCGYPPFNGINDEEIIKKVKRGKFSTDEEEWVDISADAIDLVNKLLDYNPDSRLGAKEALQHKWILEYSKIELDKKVTQKTLSNLRNFSVSINHFFITLFF
jgi:calcium-dependent protein kinase